ncbi:MAG TPA: DNA primase [Gemmatimonadaceae bacterium]|nr:DNA primase [Gemmatimonadaceae bacterium]
MIPDDVVERVREHADIVAIVGELVKLKRVGNSFRGPCPFHQGKDPNFSVSPRGGYVCFVCHEKGDVFTFVQKRLGLDFVDAVKYVGAKSGIEVREVTRAAALGPDPRERFWEINGAAAEYFTRALWDDDRGAAAREYLASRRLDRDVAQRFGLGFAPRDAQSLREHLETLGYGVSVQVEAGLLLIREGEAEARPRFRGRLMFPIYDPQNRVIAFGGRVLGDGQPKYLNSAESPTFQKGSTLYGLNWAKTAIRKDDRVLLVEGYFDCVRLLSAGLEATVAPLGTALTEAQAEMIRKYTANAFLLYDSDRAGLKATFRAGDMLLRHGLKVHVVTLPDGEDPDTYVSRHGKDKLAMHLGQAIDVFERKVQILERGGWFSDLRRKRVALDRLLTTIRAAVDPITRGLYLARAAQAVGVSESALERELELERASGIRGRETPPPEERRPARRAQKVTVAEAAAERELVRLLLHRRREIETVAERIGPRDFEGPRLRQIFSQLTEAPDAPIDALAAQLDPGSVALLDELLANPGGLDDPARIIADCLSTFRQRDLARERLDLDRQRSVADSTSKDEINLEKHRLQQEARKTGGTAPWNQFKRTDTRP